MSWIPAKNLGQVGSYRIPGPALLPTVRQTTPPSLGGPALGQLGSVGPVPSLIGAALGAGTAWVGWTVGSEKSGFLSVTGYVVGVLGAVGALGGAVSFLSGLSK